MVLVENVHLIATRKPQQMEHTNMCHETLIAERIVNDHVTSVGGMMGVDINKELLASCQA